MNSEAYLKQSDEEAQAWGAWLSKYEWHYFGTFTFSEQYTAVGARRAFERFIAKSEIKTFDACFFGIERGDRYGRIHLHSLFQYHQPATRPTAKLIWELWFKTYGRAKVEIPKDIISVSSYCAKYTSKGMVDYDMIGNPKKKLT